MIEEGQDDFAVFTTPVYLLTVSVGNVNPREYCVLGRSASDILCVVESDNRLKQLGEGESLDIRVKKISSGLYMSQTILEKLREK